jgi:two-component system, chemotaxis family, chemotaxis protein CheY
MLRTILVVDDSSVIHQMCARFLSPYPGTTLVSAMNGAEALEQLSREPEIDLILLDINMPVMNGLELLERLNDQAAYRGIPAIVIATQGREMDTERCLAAGARGYVTKPFQARDLHEAIEKVTGEKPLP